jgi:protein-S-isoprenylcysteine O-methyltransferase Ste14
MSRNPISLFLLTVQFITIGFLLVTGPLFARRIDFLVVELVGISVGVLAVIELRRFNLVPEIRKGSTLVTKGLYEYIRHPMYSALLLTCLALLVDHLTFLRFVAYVLLIIVLIMKLHIEERLLEHRFPEYKQYKKKTKRLLPFVY